MQSPHTNTQEYTTHQNRHQKTDHYSYRTLTTVQVVAMKRVRWRCWVMDKQSGNMIQMEIDGLIER